MRPKIRPAFTLVELLTVVAIISLLISILLPALTRARETANRAGCLANMSLVMKGVTVYAKEYGDGKFPNWGQQEAGFRDMGRGWDWDGNDNNGTGGNGWVNNDPFRNAAGVANSVVSNTRNYYLLIRKKLADTKNFQCYSDPEFQAAFQPADPEKTWDFLYRGQVSFSMQYQGPARDKSSGDTTAGWQTSMSDDPRLVIFADKSPLIVPELPMQANRPVDGYQYYLPTSVADGLYWEFCRVLRDVESNAGTAYGDTRINPDTGKFEPGFTNREDAPSLNSPNHKSEGQNFVRLDGSGAFGNDPWQGAANDNIYTPQNSDDIALTGSVANNTDSLVARVCGAFPNSGNAAAANEDALLREWMVAPRYNKTVYPDSFLVP